MERTCGFKLAPSALWTGLILSVCLLQGCAIAPGFGSVRAEEGDQSLPVEFQYLPADGGLNGIIAPITPALIRTQNQLRPRVIPQDVKNLFGKPAPYTIGPGDVIGIIVYDHPELLPNAGAVISQQTDPTGVSVAPGFIVGANGEISFPYIGKAKLVGLTEIEASDLIASKISEYIKSPQVTVRIQSFRSRRAYVEGEVRTPGMQIFTDIPMTLAEALSRAGDVTPNGDRSYVTLTRGGNTTALNLPLLQEMGGSARDIPLFNGDVINVRNRDESKVYVMGEILRPSPLLMRNGRLSLNEALGEAGGPNLATADASQVYVLRNTADGQSQIFHINVKNPAALALADKFALMPRDVVYIDSVPLVTWNRIVSLILPSAQIVNLGSEVSTR